ncbi:MAG: hypothetical protein OXH51_07620 [Gemmatimonadetes bacterium]|nr:hypothetical protein [Gemmatimonadota bacterium]MCY3611387.1 hypothetical protein [Gemmatimonadota bacterium]MCY3677589.1 hypothetical protein [Gemmatimonadota bacterium]MYA40294.1 hypothetical protein [Gemmatimonadota bacterium]MYE93659.1 hypothetical protein [Gemmatimonadota bacterium]
MKPFHEREKRALLRSVADGVENPVCPRCGGRCSVIRTRTRADVSYVRDRVVIRCSGCMRTLALEAG